MPTHTDLNLTGGTSLFVGRGKEVTKIRRLLADPQCRLLTLTGPGGIGKTTLALEVGAQFSGFDDGIHFVALQPLTSSDQLVPTIASAVGLTLPGNEPLATQLFRQLQPKQLLLILDNFEHLLAGADLLVELLAAAPAVKLLVTSREMIGVREEWLYPVQGLAIPGQGASGDLASYGSVHLFNVRARQLRHDFRWQKEKEAVISICRQVEGNPLALVLAASWLSVLSCTAIAEKIRQGLEFLAPPLRNFPERHSSMHAVFDHSWHLLKEHEREVFCRLTVLRGGFTIEVAGAVAGASLSEISALLFKSMIRQEQDGRYQIHELLRQYGAAKLAAFPAEEMAAMRAFAGYFLTFLREQRLLYDGPKQLHSIQATAVEYENIYAAFRWSVQHMQSAEDAEAIRHAFSPIISFCQIRGRYLEGAELFAATIRRFEMDERVELCRGVLAECLTGLGWLDFRLGRFTQAREALTRSIRLYEEFKLSPPPYPTGHPRMALLFLSLVLGDYEQAFQLGQELSLHAMQQNQPAALALASYGLASAALEQGAFEQARHDGMKALALTESLDVLYLRVNIHDLLGQVAAVLKEWPAARRHFQAAYAISSTYEAYGNMALHLKNLGDVALHQQQWPEAGAFYQQSLERYQTIGDQGGIASAERALGITAYQMGDAERAQNHFRKALAIAAATQSLRTILAVLAAVGSFMVERRKAGHRRALGLRLLQFVAHHPSCDRMTHEEATDSLLRSGVQMEEQEGATLEALLSLLQAELVEADEVNPSKLSTNGSRQPDAIDLVEPLTTREVEVLKLLAKGRSNAEIANTLQIAVGTVKAHTSSIYRKLEVTTRVQAVTRIHELGILT